MNRPGVRKTLHTLAAGAVAVVGIGLLATPAGAEPGLTDAGTTTGSVTVDSGITLTALTATFAISGVPGDVDVAAAASVTMNVATNNVAGYNVTVEPQTATFTGAAPGNTDTIDVGALEVQGTGTVGGTFEALTFGTPTQTFTKSTASAEAGDTVTNTYQMTIPFVLPDTYSTVLDYVATTL
jgi:hypothetical protein